MNCEIEFLPVGKASKAGDAIVVRYGSPSAYQLMVVDAGFDGTGAELVAHIKKHFSGKSIAHALLTHGDRDHAAGFRSVLNDLVVQNFWLHQPWDVDVSDLAYFADKRLTVESLRRKIRSEYELLAELVDTAIDKGISVRAPYAGDSVGPFQVLSPSKDAYRLLVPQFDRTPEPDVDTVKAAGMWIGKAMPSGLLAALGVIAEKVAEVAQRTFFIESWTRERLKDDGAVTSASNESSVVLYSLHDAGRALLTGDAGVFALTMAADRADYQGLPLQQFTFVQMPHHGSRRNVGPTILTRILGPIVAEGTQSRFTTFVSAPQDDVTHPRQMVVNAFLRRGGRVVATQGRSVLHRGGFPQRPGYTSVTPMPFVEKIEDYD